MQQRRGGWMAVAATLCYLVACSIGPPPEGKPAGVSQTRPVLPEGQLAFILHAPQGEPLAHVSVLAVNAGGVQKLGETGRLGVLAILKRDLEDLQPYVVVFCHRDYPCGALLVNERFYQFDERSVRLAPAVFH